MLITLPAKKKKSRDLVLILINTNFNVAGNSFPYFPRLRFKGVIITTLSVDAKNHGVKKNCLIIGEHVAVNFVAQ